MDANVDFIPQFTEGEQKLFCELEKYLKAQAQHIERQGDVTPQERQLLVDIANSFSFTLAADVMRVITTQSSNTLSKTTALLDVKMFYTNSFTGKEQIVAEGFFQTQALVNSRGEISIAQDGSSNLHLLALSADEQDPAIRPLLHNLCTSELFIQLLAKATNLEGFKIFVARNPDFTVFRKGAFITAVPRSYPSEPIRHRKI